MDVDRSRSTRETSRSRRSASIARLDEAHRLARRSEVPKSRLCPSGEPNEALAQEALIAGWFPLFQRENETASQSHAGLRTMKRDSDNATSRAKLGTFADRCGRAHATCAAVARLEANARSHHHDFARKAKIRVDVSSHSSRKR